MKTTLTGTTTRPNRRKASPGRKGRIKSFRSGKKNRKSNGSINGARKGSITDGHNPHYGKRKTAKSKINLPTITPWKVILTSSLIGICGLFYITHVFSTQQVLQEVQQLENEFNKVNRIHAEKRLEYDRLVGPKEIYHRAREAGFINAGPANHVIILKK